MKNILSVIIIVSMLVSVISCSREQTRELVQLPVSRDKNFLDSLQALSVYNVAKYFPNESELAIALIRSDSDQFIGIKRRNDSLVYIENSNLAFEIGSITKTFTATILAKLVYDGKVDLNEPISNILPVKMNQDELDGKKVTLLHLANHTSGFPKEPGNLVLDLTLPGSPYKTYDKNKIYSFLSENLILQSTPGTKRDYSNLGGGLLGHLLELITGQPYEQLLQELICKPLNMDRTFVTIDPERKHYLVPGRNLQGQIIPNWELNVFVGSGGIKSTAEDIAKYLHAQMRDTTFFFLTQKPTIQYNDHNEAGLGWTWFTDEKLKYVAATGGTGGYSSIVIFERSTQTAIVLLTNVSSFIASQGDYISKLGIELHNSLLRNN